MLERFSSAEVAGDGVVLRRPESRDVGDLVACWSDPVLRRFAPVAPDPITPTDAERYVREYVPARWAAGLAEFAVTEPGVGRLLGRAALTAVSAGDASGTVSVLLGSAARDRGLGPAALETITGWAFGRGLGRVELAADVDDVAAQRAALACGYRREGVRRGGRLRRDGVRRDRVGYARLVGDPPGPVRRLLPDLPGGSLTDGLLTLSPTTAADAGDTFRLRTTPDVVATWVPPVAPGESEVRDRCERAQAQWLDAVVAEMVVRESTTGAYVGEISLHYQGPVLRQAMLGYGVVPEHRRKGYAGRMIALAVAWAFEHAGMERLTAGTLVDNVGSQRALERVGFRREGLQRGLLPAADGTRRDNVDFALLRSDWHRRD